MLRVLSENLVLLLAFATVAYADDGLANPGFAVVLSNAGFGFIGQKAFAVGLAAAQDLKIPDMANQRFDCEGKCYWSISGAVLKGLTCGQPTFKFTTTGIDVEIPSCSATVSDCAWRIHRSTFPSLSCSGTLDLSVSDISIAVVLQVSMSATHTLSIKAASATVHIGGDHMDFHHGGSCSVITSAVHGMIQKAIVKGINDQLNTQLPTLINQALEKFVFPESIAIGNETEIRLDLPAAPAVSATGLSFELSGDVQVVGSPTQYNGTCPALALPAPTEMVAVVLSECVANSAAWALTDEGRTELQHNVTLFGIPVELNIGAPIAPTVSFTNGTSTLNFNATVDAECAKLSLDITIAVGGSVPLQLAVAGGNITAKVDDVALSELDIVVSFHNHSIGPLDPAIVDELLDKAINQYVLPLVNKRLGEGFPIPSFQGIALSQATIIMDAAAVTIQASFEAQGEEEEEGQGVPVVLVEEAEAVLSEDEDDGALLALDLE